LKLGKITYVEYLLTELMKIWFKWFNIAKNVYIVPVPKTCWTSNERMICRGFLLIIFPWVQKCFTALKVKIFPF